MRFNVSFTALLLTIWLASLPGCWRSAKPPCPVAPQPLPLPAPIIVRPVTVSCLDPGPSPRPTLAASVETTDVLRASMLSMVDAWRWMDAAEVCLEEIRRVKREAGEVTE